MSELSVITIGIDPMIHIGPVTLAWHGVTIALGVLLGGVVASRDARRRGLDPEPMQVIGMILIVTALVGARVFYLAEHGGLLTPAEWFGTRGFTFYGGFIAAAIGIVLYVRGTGRDIRYLDAAALGFAFGYAIGRIGDIINGEHYGPASTFFLAVRNSNPAADTPTTTLAYHNGGLYEVLIGAVTFIVAFALRRRLETPMATVWLVLGLLSVGRFLEFFVRSDSATVALGLETAQWTSLALLAVAVVMATRGRRRRRPRPSAALPQGR